MRDSEQFSVAWSSGIAGQENPPAEDQNGSGRVIPWNLVALAAFERRSQFSGHAETVFLADDGKPMIRKFIRRWFEEALVKNQIRGVRWHCIRLALATRLVMAGVALKAFLESMGHKTVQMTARYAHLSPNQLQSVVELTAGAKPAKQPLEKRTATGTKKATRKG